MSPSLLALLVSMVAASPDPVTESHASTPMGAGAASVNSARAKVGLLPRRASRPRVTYLEGAAIPDAEVTPSPVPARSTPVDAGAVEIAAADGDVDADWEEDAVGDTEAETSSPEPRAAAPAGDAVRTPDGGVAPVVPLVRGAEVATTPAPTPPAAPTLADGPASAARGAASPGLEAQAPRAAIERIVDAAGEVVVRVTGPDAKVIAERVVCSLGDLPVLSTRRADDGGVVQVVADEWGGVEVRRDAVGRFVSARPIERAAHPGRQD